MSAGGGEGRAKTPHFYWRACQRNINLHFFSLSMPPGVCWANSDALEHIIVHEERKNIDFDVFLIVFVFIIKNLVLFYVFEHPLEPNNQRKNALKL